MALASPRKLYAGNFLAPSVPGSLECQQDMAHTGTVVVVEQGSTDAPETRTI